MHVHLWESRHAARIKMMAKIYNGRAETAGECESEQTKREKKKWKIGKRSWIVRGKKKKKQGKP